MTTRYRNGHRRLRHFAFQRRKPRGVGSAFAEKTQPFAHGFFVTLDTRAMRRIEAIDKAVEKFPPRRRAVRQQTIHIGRNPRQRDVFGEFILAARGPAVDMDEALFAFGVGRFSARADAQQTGFGAQIHGGCPRFRFRDPEDRTGRCAANRAREQAG